MARLCSFEINYKNQTYPTLISVLKQQEDTICRIRYIQSTLGHIACGDVLIYSLRDGLKGPQQMPPDLTEELKRCISQVALVNG